MAMEPSEKSKLAPLRKPVKCPNCGKASNRDSYPFCCKRCADIDLNRWFGEHYTLPSNEAAGFEFDQE